VEASASAKSWAEELVVWFVSELTLWGVRELRLWAVRGGEAKRKRLRGTALRRSLKEAAG
jgi:hypothetical protein